MSMRTILWASVLFVGVGLLGCNKQRAQETLPREARAQLASAEGRDVSGVVMFYQTDGGVRVEANIEGLEPGPHGFHIHENGECVPPDFTSAGDHFAPDGNPHGPPGPTSHAGDLGNLVAGPGGLATMSQTSQDISLEPQSKDSIIGRAVVVHADPDDLTSQPSGNAGARIACGVIQAVESD